MPDEIPARFRWLPAMGSEDCSNHDLPRAHRFGIELPIRYRASGETTWHRGRTANISRTGVLFRTDRLMNAHTQIAMSLELPGEIGDETRVEILCRGEIVRTVPAAPTEAQSGLVATILEYRFVRGRDKFAA